MWDGLQIAKEVIDAGARGVKMGRKPKLTAHQRQQAVKRLVDGDETTREIARDYAVHHSTIARLKA